jgi:hypothetical protein
MMADLNDLRKKHSESDLSGRNSTKRGELNELRKRTHSESDLSERN